MWWTWGPLTSPCPPAKPLLPETMRVLHILDHSIPLHSGYTFRTLSLLREQRKLGWETHHLTSPKHTAPSEAEETVDGWHFFRTAASSQKARTS